MAHTSTTDTSKLMTLEERRAFLKLPLAERRRLMAQQAEKMAEFYKSAQEAAERQAWQGGDIVESQ